MESKDRKFYDEAFAEVFTNRSIIQSLLEDFVHEKWVRQIVFSSMEVEKSVFKGISDSKRESDILLKFNLKKRSPAELYIFVLLEFQSKPEAMILRLLEYLTRVYKKQKREFNCLYPVVPMVIYNGREHWKEKNSFLKNLKGCSKDIEKYIPNFKYILIDIARYDDKMLQGLKDSVAYFFLLDKTDLSKRHDAASRIIRVLRQMREVNPEIFTLLGRYIQGLLEFKGVEINEINSYINDRSDSMLAQSLDELYEEGLEKGREEGRDSGKQETLISLLDKKFHISEVDKKLIVSNRDSSLLDDALDIILFASTAEEVLSIFKK